MHLALSETLLVKKETNVIHEIVKYELLKVFIIKHGNFVIVRVRKSISRIQEIESHSQPRRKCFLLAIVTRQTTLLLVDSTYVY